ncbi:MAG: VWA domain-containing protein [Caldilineaceae bacterium]|nr:VWA domain-containing protein [Caldilineaceae bacterium]
MNFLTPAAFALALLLPIIVAMYLLKLRRTEQVIASVYLWQRMVRDVEANAPWQRLRRNLLLLLQLLFLIVLILALARPFLWIEGIGGQTAVFVIDTSASMTSRDGSPTRLDDARRQLYALIDGLPVGARATVIDAGDEVRVVASSSQDRRQLHAVVEGLTARPGGSNLSAALELAVAIAARQPDAEIVLLSDFAGADLDQLRSRMPSGAAVRFLTVGNRGDNQAISAFSLQPSPNGITAFVQVANYGESDAVRRLLLALGEGEPTFAAYDLTIPAQGEEIVVIDDFPADTTVVSAILDSEDALPLDDRAWAILRTDDPAAVTLVTSGNRFLETALALLPGISVTTVRPTDYERTPAADAALTIFDSYAPITATLPAGNLLFVGPPRSTAIFSVTGELEGPLPQVVDRNDPLLMHVNLVDVSILRAATIPTPDWARPLVIDGGGDDSSPLLVAGETDGRRIAVLAFALQDSDLPLQVAFPLLLTNLTDWLAAGGAQIPAQVRPGEPIQFSPPHSVDAVTVFAPGGRSLRLLPDNGRVLFAETGDLGLYQLSWDGAVQARFAVNLFAPQESSVQPQTVADLGGAAIPGARIEQSRQEWWRPLALLALALLVAEWMVYHRGAVGRIVDGVRRVS